MRSAARCSAPVAADALHCWTHRRARPDRAEPCRRRRARGHCNAALAVRSSDVADLVLAVERSDFGSIAWPSGEERRPPILQASPTCARDSSAQPGWRCVAGRPGNPASGCRPSREHEPAAQPRPSHHASLRGALRPGRRHCTGLHGAATVSGSPLRTDRLARIRESSTLPRHLELRTCALR
jgi:hypothetical protein